MPQITRRNLIFTGAVAGASLTALGPQVAAMAQDDKPTIKVGSKDFTEAILLGEILAQIFENADYPVERHSTLGGTVVAHEALVHGDIDVYMEYTGTGLLAILGEDLPESLQPGASASPDSGASQKNIKDQVYDIVSEEYEEQFDLTWLEPWGFNNTYAMAVRDETADELGLTTISDIVDDAGDMTLGAPQEFLARPDGLEGLEETYDISFKAEQGMDPGLVYSAVNEGEVDIIAANSTDGRIPAFDLVLLEDNKGFFPPYYAAPVVRDDLLDAAPEVADLLNQLAGQITDEQMASINSRVDTDGLEPQDVAREFLQEQGILKSDS